MRDSLSRLRESPQGLILPALGLLEVRALGLSAPCRVRTILREEANTPSTWVHVQGTLADLPSWLSTCIRELSEVGGWRAEEVGGSSKPSSRTLQFESVPRWDLITGQIKESSTVHPKSSLNLFQLFC